MVTNYHYLFFINLSKKYNNIAAQFDSCGYLNKKALDLINNTIDFNNVRYHFS